MWVMYVLEPEMHRNELEDSPSKKSVSSAHIGPALLLCGQSNERVSMHTHDNTSG